MFSWHYADYSILSPPVITMETLKNAQHHCSGLLVLLQSQHQRQKQATSPASPLAYYSQSVWHIRLTLVGDPTASSFFFSFHMKNRVHLSHIRLFLFLLYLYLTTQPHAAVTQAQAAMSRDTDPSSQSAACRCSAHIQDQLYLLDNIFITCSYIKKICLYCGFLFLPPHLSFHLSTSMSFIALPTDARIFLLTLGCLAICAGRKQLHLLIKARTAREIYIGRLHCSKTPD